MFIKITFFALIFYSSGLSFINKGVSSAFGETKCSPCPSCPPCNSCPTCAPRNSCPPCPTCAPGHVPSPQSCNNCQSECDNIIPLEDQERNSALENNRVRRTIFPVDVPPPPRPPYRPKPCRSKKKCKKCKKCPKKRSCKCKKCDCHCKPPHGAPAPFNG
ncbi:uncharacterized protein [Parasteatoda tepidariorum]|uniref:uncharacterized protein n=1 Tax=Parasteatoda tepidariorum TaxID=114398 RepID=UPI001C71BA08|nr:sperm mitochondrial-associated cysteine-rich protein-like [Parasteatoda tepidariorum]